MIIKDTLRSLILFIKQTTIVRTKFFTILYLIVFLIPSLASANNFYVSPSGNNLNIGSLNSPFKTINYGVSRLRAGDLLYIRAGTYVEKINISNSGTASDPIVITAYPGELPIIDGTDIYIDGTSALVVFWASYIHLIGFEIRNSSSTGIVSEGTNNLISHCTIHSVFGSAIGLGGNYDIAEYCTVYNCAMSNENGVKSISWPSGISARRSPSYCIIRHCIVHDVWGEGISTFEATHTTIEDNTVYDCWSVGIYISDATDCIAQRNLVYLTKTLTNGPMVGLGYWNEKNSPSNARNTIINNIVYGCYRNLYVGSPLIGTLIANNTFVNSIFESCIQMSGGDHAGAEFKNNLIIQENGLQCSNTTYDANVTYSHNLYNKSYDTDAVGPGDVIGDPKLAKTGDTSAGKLTAEYFKLLSTSSAINKGTVISQVMQDFFGDARDATPDIGAHEYYAPDPTVKVTDITVTGAGGATTITTDNGTLQLSAAVAPTSATNKTVVWSLTNDTGQAIISTTGLVTAFVDGTVTARATSNDGSGVFGTLMITISNQVILVNRITVTGAGGASTITTDNGTLQLSADILPSNATNEAVTWSITNGSSLVSLNASTGLVTAIENGAVTLRATANDGSGIYGTLVITISNQVIPVTSILVTGAGGATTITTYNGSLQLNSAVTPFNASNQNVTWTIENGTGKAGISSAGLITAISDGTVIARATAIDNSGVFGTLVITISNQVIPESPVFVKSAIENATPAVLRMVYNLSLAGVVPAPSSFNVVVNSVTRKINAIGISGTMVLLTLASPVTYGDAVTVSYTRPATNPLQTASGGQAVTINAKSVTNNVLPINIPPVVVVNAASSNLSGFVGQMDATGSYDPNNDNLSYVWVVPDNVSVSAKTGSKIQFLSPIVNTPKTVQFTLYISDGKTTQSKVIQVEILPYKPELEIAEVLNVEASGFQSPNYPYNIIDGNIGTMWTANGENQWIILVLKEAFNIQHVELAFLLGQSRESYFDILGSQDKVTWEPILIKSASCAFSGDIQVFDFPQSKTEKEFKYVKLVGHSNSIDSWNYISEFRIFGYRHRNPTSYEDQPVKIYPNPAHKFINIRIDETTLKLDFIRIVNLAGKIVFQDIMNPDIKDFIVPLSLMQGAYIVQLGSNGLTLFGQKLIISK